MCAHRDGVNASLPFHGLGADPRSAVGSNRRVSPPSDSPPPTPEPSPPSLARLPGRGAVLVSAALVLAGVGAAVLLWPKADPVASGGVTRAAHSSGISQVEVERADWRAQLCTSANAVGVGLRGEYFARAGWAGDALMVRTDATLEFGEGLDWPAGQAGVPRSVRWSGWVRAPLTGRYRFHADPPGVSVEVAGQRVGGADSPADAAVELAAGRFYPIAVAWDRMEPQAGAMRLQWTAPHGARFTIPRNALFLPTESVSAPR